MGRSRYNIGDPAAPHFLTCTILNWIPVFTAPQAVHIVLNALRYRQENQQWKIYGFVILENHLHLIVQAQNLLQEFPLFKSFTARKIIDLLKTSHYQTFLTQLFSFKKEHKADRDYQLWEEGSHPQMIESEMVLRQKLNYIHDNLVRRGYVDLASDWRYSSARDYELNKEGLLPIFKEWIY